VRVLRLALLSLLALIPLAPGAFALDGEVVLRFRDGRLLPGRVETLSDEGVRHASDRGAITWRWEDLTPFSCYEVRASVLAGDDGPGRLALGRWCLAQGLPTEARKEILRARGLGAGDAATIDGLLAACDEDEAGAAFAEADRKVAAGDLDGALDALRAYLLRAPASSWTDKARERAADLVRRGEDAEARRRLEEAQEKKARDEGRRDEYLRETLDDADAYRTDGGRIALVGIREEIGGSFTRFRGALLEAEARFLEALKLYKRARRAAANDRPGPAASALAGRFAAEERLLDVYLRLARAFVAAKTWKDAQAVLDKALRLDPVNGEALDLQKKVSENWIRRKASELTGATGHTSDGSGR